MIPDEAAALVAEMCRNLTLMQRCDDKARVGDAVLLARYRDVADALGCRAEFEDALLKQTVRRRPPADHQTTAEAG